MSPRDNQIHYRISNTRSNDIILSITKIFSISKVSIVYKDEIVKLRRVVPLEVHVDILATIIAVRPSRQTRPWRRGVRIRRHVRESGVCAPANDVVAHESVFRVLEEDVRAPEEVAAPRSYGEDGTIWACCVRTGDPLRIELSVLRH